MTHRPTESSSSAIPRSSPASATPIWPRWPRLRCEKIRPRRDHLPPGRRQPGAVHRRQGKVRVFTTSPAGGETSIVIFSVGDDHRRVTRRDARPRSATAKAIAADVAAGHDPDTPAPAHAAPCRTWRWAFIRLLADKARWTTGLRRGGRPVRRRGPPDVHPPALQRAVWRRQRSRAKCTNWTWG